VRTESILKVYNSLIVPTFLYGSENWTVTASQRRGIEAAELKLLRLLAGYTLHDHKANDFIRRELKTTGILGKLDEYRLNWNLHLQRMPQTEYRSNHTTTDHKEGAQLEDQRNVDENSFNSGDGTDQTGPILDVYYYYYIIIIIIIIITIASTLFPDCHGNIDKLLLYIRAVVRILNPLPPE